MIRFNEGIDQAISESTVRFMRDLDESRDLVTAVLAHDLRNRLNSILSCAQLLLRTKAADIDESILPGLIQSGQRMGILIQNLLDFTRVRLGGQLPVRRESVDLGNLCRAIVAEFKNSHPEKRIDCDWAGHLVGMWDSNRIKQLLSNLVSNAIEHGAKNAPITVALWGSWANAYSSTQPRESNSSSHDFKCF